MLRGIEERQKKKGEKYKRGKKEGMNTDRYQVGFRLIYIPINQAFKLLNDKPVFWFKLSENAWFMY